jgi:hypothetical protein
VTTGRWRSLRNSSASESCKKKGSRWCVRPCSSAMIFGSRQRWRRPCSAREGMGCRVRSRPSKGRERCKERAERGGQRRPKASPSTPAPAMFLGLSCLGKRWGLSVWFSSERRCGGEANERQGRAPERVRGFIWSGWSRCRVHLDNHGWARGAAFLEGCCESSAALGVARSGVH